MSNRPPDVWGFEEEAETEALFDEGDRVVYDPAPEFDSIPARAGKVRWRRWECGNRCWGYALDLDTVEGVPGHNGTMAIESYIRTEKPA